MRRLDKEVKEPEKLKKILRETSFVTLAMCRDKEPYLISLSHSYDEEENCLYFHCASEGKKLEILRQNPEVWGQALIDHGYYGGHCSHIYVSAMFRGRVEFVDDPEKKRKIFIHMIKHQDKNPDPIVERLTNLDALVKTVVGRIFIEDITGKKSAEVDF